MSVSITSPNVDNYQIGKSKVYFKKDGAVGDVLDYEVGNCSEAELTPTIERLDHFSSREGVRKKDKSIVLESGLQIRIVMEEFTPRNLELMLLGTPNVTDPAAVTIDILSQNVVRGHLRLVGTNDEGPKWTYDLPAVEFSPSGSLNVISEEWGNMEVTGEVLASGDPSSFGTATGDFSEATAPTNTLVPSIAGVAQVDEVLTANTGTWTGAPVFTYVWQVDDGGGYDPIVGATAKTYTPVIGQIGFPIRVVVTGTNGAGSANATSAPTADVIAA